MCHFKSFCCWRPVATATSSRRRDISYGRCRNGGVPRLGRFVACISPAFASAAPSQGGGGPAVTTWREVAVPMGRNSQWSTASRPVVRPFLVCGKERSDWRPNYSPHMSLPRKFLKWLPVSGIARLESSDGRCGALLWRTFLLRRIATSIVASSIRTGRSSLLRATL